MKNATTQLDRFWSIDPVAVLAALESNDRGLGSGEARTRMAEHARERMGGRGHTSALRLLARQFANPITLMLIAAAVVSGIVHDAADAAIILLIVAGSGLLGFAQESSASHAVEKLLASIRIRARVVRDGVATEIPTEDVVPGDIVELGPGDVVPADARLLDARAFFVDEATLTGESFPVEKTSDSAPADAPLAKRASAVFMGTHVVSGGARAVAVRIGRSTELGAVSERLDTERDTTEFERGVRHLGSLLLEITLLFVIGIFACNVYLKRPVLDSLMFAIALAVGLTPQLLPAIVSVNLARGSKRMAAARVVVKRLASIENFGSMNVLCTDKTGTLTEGIVHLGASLAYDGAASDEPLHLARLNAARATPYPNPIDDAIRASGAADAEAWRTAGELPYDFARKRVSVLLARGDERLVVVKGAVRPVVACCTRARRADGSVVPMGQIQGALDALVARLSDEGERVLAIASRDFAGHDELRVGDESDLVLVGLLTLHDQPKPGIVETLRRLRDAGIRVCLLTGDAEACARHVAKQVGLVAPTVVTGATLATTNDAALVRLASRANVFAELAPYDKERIVRALRAAGDVVGFLGDGINDASAIHAADVGISVDTAADVAKDAADIVLLDKDLGVLLAGVEEGRRTFANTLKYVFMATSANFGNMFSMAGASLILPFLPLLPKQVLLTNLCTDVPEMTISDDRVDDDWTVRPRRWDMRFLTRFMIVFGLVSSIFDYLTFAVLIYVMHANVAEFRTGWFVESVVSATVIVLVVRTRQPFWRSRPAKSLATAVAGAIVFATLLPWTPLAGPLGLVALPGRFCGAVGLIVLAYAGTVEVVKHFFYRHTDQRELRSEHPVAQRRPKGVIHLKKQHAP